MTGHGAALADASSGPAPARRALKRGDTIAAVLAGRRRTRPPVHRRRPARARHGRDLHLHALPGAGVLPADGGALRGAAASPGARSIAAARRAAAEHHARSRRSTRRRCSTPTARRCGAEPARGDSPAATRRGAAAGARLLGLRRAERRAARSHAGHGARRSATGGSSRSGAATAGRLDEVTTALRTRRRTRRTAEQLLAVGGVLQALGVEHGDLGRASSGRGRLLPLGQDAADGEERRAGQLGQLLAGQRVRARSTRRRRAAFTVVRRSSVCASR